MDSKKCLRCGSKKLMEGAHIQTAHQALVMRKPKAPVRKQPAIAPVRADICADCGHIHLRCDGNVAELWEAYVEAGKTQ